MDREGIVYIGGSRVSSDEANIKVVFSDAITEEFRGRKSDTEFPMSLESLESYISLFGIAKTDFAFLPPQQAYREMSENGEALLTLGLRGQAPFPVREACVWGINIMNHLQAPAFFELLRLSGIPAFRSERDMRHPLVVLGGQLPNPLPLSEFYDALVVGDGEEAFLKIVDLRSSFDGGRRELLDSISKLEGLYVPGYTAMPVKRLQVDFADPRYAAGSSFLVNGVGAVVLSRGCPHECAFCCSRYSSGRYRIKPFSQIAACIDLLKDHGARKLMLVAASASCYRSEGKTALDVMEYASNRGLRVRSMSDRPEEFSEAYLRLAVPDKGKIILAPEASPRLRFAVLRKSMDEGAIHAAADAAIRAGISYIKIYAIIAIPAISPGVVDFLPEGFAGETPEDISYLAELGMGIAKRMRDAGLTRPDGKPYVNLDCMPLIPAIGTPLQKLAFPAYSTYRDRLESLRESIRPEYRESVSVTAGMDETTHLLQAFLERGDAGAGPTLWRIWEKSRLWPIEHSELAAALEAAGKPWSALGAEYNDGELPYERLIEET